MANCGRKRIIAAIMALAIVAGAAPAKPISDLFMPELSVSAAEASTSKVSLAGRVVEAGGKLTVKYYFNVAEDFAFNETAYVKFTCNKEETIVNFTQAEKVSGMLMVKYDIAAKQMADQIKVEVFENTAAKENIWDNTDKIAESSVKAYAETLISKGDKATPVLKAMLNYGAYAQTYFKYNTSNLANSSLTAAEKDVSSVTKETVKSYVPEVIKEETKISAGIYGASASLEAETELNMFLHVGSDIKSVKKLAFSCTDGHNKYDVVAEDAEQGGKACYKVKIKGVATKGFGEDLILSITDDATDGEANDGAVSNVVIKCCVNDYINTAMNYPDSYKTLKDMSAALYLYNQAAVDYFDSVRTVAISFNGALSDYTKHEYDSAKAFKETVGQDDNGKDIEKFLFTVPANMEGNNGVGEVKIMYVSDGVIKYVDNSSIEVKYDDYNGVTTIFVEEDALKEDVMYTIQASVAEAYDLTVAKKNGAKDTLEASNKKVFNGQKFVTTLSAKNDGEALPAELDEVIYGGNTYDPSYEGTAYTYNPTTGEFVVLNPTSAIVIKADAVKSTIIESKLTNLTGEFPATVGESFSTVLTVTDTENYKIPTELTFYGVNTEPDGYYSVLNSDNKTRTYYKSDGTPIEYAAANKINDKSTDAEKEAAQLKTLEGLMDGKFYYIIDINNDGTAKLTVNGIDSTNVEDDKEGILINAKATQYFNVTYTVDESLVYSSAPIYMDTEEEELVIEDKVATTVDKGKTTGSVYFALKSEEENVDIPTAITVKMNGEELEAGDYTWREYDGFTETSTKKEVKNYELKVENVTGDIEVIAAATEMFTVVKTLNNSLELYDAAGKEIIINKSTQSVGKFTSILKPTNDKVQLPSSINVSVKSGNTTTELTQGVGYTYDSKTGKIVVFNLKKGETLTITATGASTTTVSVTSSKIAIDNIDIDDSTPLIGEDVTIAVELPSYEDLYGTYTGEEEDKPVISCSELTVKCGTKEISDKVSSTEAYYTYTAGTGKKLGNDTLVIYNISGPVSVNIEAAAEYDFTVATTTTKGQNTGIEDAVYTLDTDKVHMDAAAKIKVTASGIEEGFDLVPTVKVGTTTLDPVVDGDSDGVDDDGNYDYIWTQDEENSNVYTLEILAGKVKDDVKVTISSVAAHYTLTLNDNNTNGVGLYTDKNCTASVDIPNVDYTAGNEAEVYYAKANAGYELPTSAVVKVGDTSYSDVYSYDAKTKVATIDLASKLKNGIVGDVVITITPSVQVSEGDVNYYANTVADDAIEDGTASPIADPSDPSVVISVGSTVVNGASAVAYYYAPSANGYLSINTALTGDYQYMYSIHSVVINNGGTEVIDQRTYNTDLTAEKALYDDALANGTTDEVTAAKTRYENAKNRPYYIAYGSEYRVYNVNDKVTVDVNVKENVSYTVQYNGTGTAKAYAIPGASGTYRIDKDAFEALGCGSFTDFSNLMIDGYSNNITITKVTKPAAEEGDPAVTLYYELTGYGAAVNASTPINIIPKAIEVEEELANLTLDKNNAKYHTASATMTLSVAEAATATKKLPDTIAIYAWTDDAWATEEMNSSTDYTYNSTTGEIAFTGVVTSKIKIVATAVDKT